jgi:glucose-6-phosphate 1-epimerase
MTDLSELNSRFAIPGQLQFSQRGEGIVVAELSNDFGSADIALQGAQVLSWVPQQSAPVFWLSEAAVFRKGQAIRGGVPICWPWFGPHETEPSFPNHGFARTRDWTFVQCRSLPGGQTELLLRLGFDEDLQDYWPHQTPIELNLVLGKSLEISLNTRNLSAGPVTITEALHAYFAVDDIRRVSVYGLEDKEYLDSVDSSRRKRQEGVVAISGETDRVYVNTPDVCLIDDPLVGRRIRIAKQGSRSTVVWNPWIEKSQRLGDMGTEAYRHMLCLETTNAAQDRVSIAPGGQHCLKAEYSVDALSEY